MRMVVTSSTASGRIWECRTTAAQLMSLSWTSMPWHHHSHPTHHHSSCCRFKASMQPASSWNTEPPKSWAIKSMIGSQSAATELPAAPAWQSLEPSLGLQLGAARSCCTGTNTSRHALNKPCTMDEPMGGVQDPGWLDCCVRAACSRFTPTLKHFALVVSTRFNTSDRGCRATSSDSSAGRSGSRRMLWKLATPPPLRLLAVAAVSGWPAGDIPGAVLSLLLLPDSVPAPAVLQLLPLLLLQRACWQLAAAASCSKRLHRRCRAQSRAQQHWEITSTRSVGIPCRSPGRLSGNPTA
jgi:hypothetical protein